MTTLPTNGAKYLSYKVAWARINQAQAAGFSFEVVTLCESIISDRLLSFVLGVAPSTKADTRTSFDSLIKLWGKHAPARPAAKDGSDLISAVDAWRVQRNAVVHGMAKSMPGSPTQAVSTFMQRAACAASEGIRLAKEVQSWHRKQLPK
jgi:hypothetical protein